MINKKKRKKKTRQVSLPAAEETHDFEHKRDGEVVEAHSSNEHVKGLFSKIKGKQWAVVHNSFSRTHKLADYESIKITSGVTLCCEQKHDDIMQATAWAEQFTQSRVEDNAQPYLDN
tara:strand:- start:1082 stop:1432 length:351 start_codon:yes stop_codon:yes gene_type:complete